MTNELNLDLDQVRAWLGVSGPAEERAPLITPGEARAVVVLLRVLDEGDDELSYVARDVAGRIARRLPAE